MLSAIASVIAAGDPGMDEDELARMVEEVVDTLADPAGRSTERTPATRPEHPDERAEPDHADFHALGDAPVAHGGVRRDARAEQRRGPGGIEIGGNAQHEALVDDDALGVAAVGHASEVLVGAVEGERQVRAELLMAGLALRTGLVGVDQAADRGEVAGLIQCHEEDDPDFRHASIDLFLSSSLHGKGFGAEAIRTLASHLLADRGHHRLAIDPMVANEAAIRCYRAVGFRPVGTLRSYQYDHEGGQWSDNLLMDLLADDFEGG